MTQRNASRPPSPVTLLAVLLAVLPGTLLVGCASRAPVGPDFASPEPTTGDGWSTPTAPTEENTDETLDAWWKRFGDPTLDRLVDRALAGNLDLRVAAARVAEARAVSDRVAGRELPSVDVGAGVTERRQSENGPLPIAEIPGLDRDQTLFEIGFDASWELDFYGRFDRAMEAAEARVEGARAEVRGARLTVAAEVVRRYLGLREGQRRLAASEAIVESLTRTAELVEKRVDAGESARLELSRIEADRRSAEARLPALRADLRASAFALGVLVGDLPESGLSLLDEPPPPIELAAFPVGERAEILRRRPDVRAAERDLAAATAEIGLATAELYPRLSIGAGGGFEALDAGDLLEGSSAYWSIVPRISWRIFDGGRVRAEIRLAEARAEAAAATWESSVLAALADAEQALARYRGELEAIEAETEAVEAARRARDLERLRHEAGEVSLLALLDAERRLDEIEAALAARRVEASSDLVALVKALGGGWS